MKDSSNLSLWWYWLVAFTWCAGHEECPWGYGSDLIVVQTKYRAICDQGASSERDAVSGQVGDQIIAQLECLENSRTVRCACYMDKKINLETLSTFFFANNLVTA